MTFHEAVPLAPALVNRASIGGFETARVVSDASGKVIFIIAVSIQEVAEVGRSYRGRKELVVGSNCGFADSVEGLYVLHQIFFLSVPGEPQPVGKEV